ncbi:hypothetical protein DFJ73DRAFT_964862 [Zopfochytrium polystomum]|nr:hypothetical protein DFJ73DRAFT_964862 [Zopfochytrium polystomum]
MDVSILPLPPRDTLQTPQASSASPQSAATSPRLAATTPLPTPSPSKTPSDSFSQGLDIVTAARRGYEKSASIASTHDASQFVTGIPGIDDLIVTGILRVKPRLHPLPARTLISASIRLRCTLSAKPSIHTRTTTLSRNLSGTLLDITHTIPVPGGPLSATVDLPFQIVVPSATAQGLPATQLVRIPPVALATVNDDAETTPTLLRGFDPSRSALSVEVAYTLDATVHYAPLLPITRGWPAATAYPTATAAVRIGRGLAPLEPAVARGFEMERLRGGPRSVAAAVTVAGDGVWCRAECPRVVVPGAPFRVRFRASVERAVPPLEAAAGRGATGESSVTIANVRFELVHEYRASVKGVLGLYESRVVKVDTATRWSDFSKLNKIDIDLPPQLPAPTSVSTTPWLQSTYRLRITVFFAQLLFGTPRSPMTFSIPVVVFPLSRDTVASAVSRRPEITAPISTAIGAVPDSGLGGCRREWGIVAAVRDRCGDVWRAGGRSLDLGRALAGKWRRSAVLWCGGT